MKKQLTVTDAELCKLWAQQKEKSGRSKTLFFRNRKLYVRSTEDLIAEFVSEKIIFVIENHRRGETQQQKWIADAISGTNIVLFIVEDFTNHSQNIEMYKRNISLCKRKRKDREFMLGIAEGIIRMMLDYAKKFNIKLDDKMLEYQKIISTGGLLNEKERKALKSKLEDEQQSNENSKMLNQLDKLYRLRL